MFDKLLESEPATANIKSRRTYFLTTALIVGVFFLTAVIASIYAADFGVGDRSIEITEMLAPVDLAASAPKPQPRTPTAPTKTNSDMPSRTDNIARVDEPTIVPDSISSAKSTSVARLDSRFRIGPVNSDIDLPTGSVSSPRGPVTGGPTGLVSAMEKEEENNATVTPPPVNKPKPSVNRTPMSGGVVNGKATNLPKPIYSAAAKAIKAGGEVKVQVTIDETGRVISASAVSGHQLLRGDAERAARNARFSPTFLTGTPVRVTGVIVYTFTM